MHEVSVDGVRYDVDRALRDRHHPQGSGSRSRDSSCPPPTTTLGPLLWWVQFSDELIASRASHQRAREHLDHVTPEVDMRGGGIPTASVPVSGLVGCVRRSTRSQRSNHGDTSWTPRGARHTTRIFGGPVPTRGLLRDGETSPVRTSASSSSGPDHVDFRQISYLAPATRSTGTG